MDLGNQIPSTRAWTPQELEFFKVYLFPVPVDKWEDYIAPKATLLTEKAQQLINCDLSAGAFNSGCHLAEGLPEVVAEFGDIITIIYNQNSSEIAVDRLIHLLLNACNPRSSVFIDLPQMNQYTVKVGSQYFISSPDASVVSRLTRSPFFIVVKDKSPFPTDASDCQVIGDMIAVASFNYFNIAQIPQTVYAMRINGDSVSFYRADFSVAYLQSILAGAPSSKLVVFRLFGAPMLVSESSKRPEIIRVLSSIYHACLSLRPYLTAGNTTPSPITTIMLGLLHGL